MPLACLLINKDKGMGIIKGKKRFKKNNWTRAGGKLIHSRSYNLNMFHVWFSLSSFNVCKRTEIRCWQSASVFLLLLRTTWGRGNTYSVCTILIGKMSLFLNLGSCFSSRQTCCSLCLNIPWLRYGGRRVGQSRKDQWASSIQKKGCSW